MYVCVCLSGIDLIISCSRFPFLVVYWDYAHAAAAFEAKLI